MNAGADRGRPAGECCRNRITWAGNEVRARELDDASGVGTKVVRCRGPVPSEVPLGSKLAVGGWQRAAAGGDHVGGRQLNSAGAFQIGRP